jgi:hypothetical protein
VFAFFALERLARHLPPAIEVVMYRSPRRATPSKSRTSHSKGKTTPQRQTPTRRKVTENPTPKKSPPQNPGSTYVFTSPNPVQKEERDLRRVRRDLAREKQLYMMELSRLERNHTPKRRKLFEDHADDAHGSFYRLLASGNNFSIVCVSNTPQRSRNSTRPPDGSSTVCLFVVGEEDRARLFFSLAHDSYDEV